MSWPRLALYERLRALKSHFRNYPRQVPFAVPRVYYVNLWFDQDKRGIARKVISQQIGIAFNRQQADSLLKRYWDNPRYGLCSELYVEKLVAEPSQRTPAFIAFRRK